MVTTEQERTDAFDAYNRATKFWGDMYGSWTKSMGSMAPSFGAPDDWSKMFRFPPDMTRFMPSELVGQVNETLAKSMNSTRKIYESWFRGMNAIAREWWDINRRLSTGEPASADRILETVQIAYQELNDIFIDTIKDTPLSGAESINAALKDAIASLPEEQVTTREFLQKLLDLSLKATNVSMTAIKESGQGIIHLMESGSLTGNGYDGTLNSYADLVKDSVEVFMSSAAPGAAKEMASDWANYIRGTLGYQVSLIEFYVKQYRGMYKSMGDINKTAEELLKGKQVTGWDQIYNFWIESSRKATDAMLKNSQFFDGLNSIIRAYYAWLSSTGKLFKGIASPPYVTKEDLATFTDELQKAQKNFEKKFAKTKAETSSRASSSAE